MNTQPDSPHLELRVSLDRASQQTTELIADLALRGPLYVVSGNDWLPSYGLTRLLRRKTIQISQVLKHVRMARAFTCYQVHDLLASTRPDPEPLVIVDLLHTFYSPDIPWRVRTRVLNQCTGYLQRLKHSRDITVLLRQEPVEDYLSFYPIVAAVADKITRSEPEPIAVSQLELF